MDAIIRMYNYQLETGTVGTDDENMATILYNINRMEMNNPYIFSNVQELNDDLDELFFMIAEAAVHLGRFLDISGDKVEADTAVAVTAAFQEAIQIVRDSRSDEADTAKMSAAFPKVYKKLLDQVPSILALDAQAAGRM